MCTSERRTSFARHRARGATAVEFAIVVAVFLLLVLGMVDFGRWLFAVNSAMEATREGARVAVVCDLDDDEIEQRMQPFLIGVTSPEADPIRISYAPAGCTPETCQSVTVELAGYRLKPLSWVFGVGTHLPVPPAKTFLPRESLSSANNPRCQ